MPDSFSTLVLIGLMVFAFYFLIMRPQRKRQQALQRTMNELQPGARVMLGSGLFGTVVSVGEKQVVLEISPGAELTVLKQAVARVVTEADEDNPAGEVEEVEPASDQVDAGQTVIEPEVAPQETPPEVPKDPRTGPTGIKE
jgi:preprotein translocase YajC subunit